MHVHEERVLEQPPDGGDIGWVGQIEVQHGGGLWLQLRMPVVDAPRI